MLTNETNDVIARGLLRQRVTNAAVRRSDTGVPDSLGDQLFRMSLKLAWAFWHPDTAPVTAELLDEANHLLKLAESGE